MDHQVHKECESMSENIAPLSPVEEALQYRFKDVSLLEEALTHSSYANENDCRDNERLEFLGDAIVGAVTTPLLLVAAPNAREKALHNLRTRIVSTEALASLGSQLNLGESLRFGKGEEKTGGREKPTILADATEAVIAAVFLDGGFEAAVSVLKPLVTPMVEIAISQFLGWQDPRSELQERFQAEQQITPHYVVNSVEGPSHQPTFKISAMASDVILGIGMGPSKKEATYQAAIDALHKIEVQKAND